MGYDFRWVTRPDGEAEEVTALYKVASNATTRDEMLAAYDEADKADRSYFRLNIGGMGVWCHLMFDLGMAFEDVPPPPWPELEGYGTTETDVYASQYPAVYPEDFKALTPERLEKANAFVAATDEVLAWHGMKDTPGIPLHKFSTNDGWLVLPAECQAAVKAWEAYVTEHGEQVAHAAISSRLGGRPADRWVAWIDYLRGAARHGGFEVR